MRSRALAPLTVLALAGSTLTVGLAAPAQANRAGTGLIISEAYGGGGNTGATLKNDFVELYNPTSAPISVQGWSVQYRSASGGDATQVTNLTGSVPAGGHYLVGQAAGSGGSVDLPTPDATGDVAMGAGGFRVWLANTTTALTPPPGNVVTSPNTAIIDFLGASTTAASYEGTAATAPSNTTSLSRSSTAPPATRDTDVNNADFAAGAPTPTNAAGQTSGGTNPGNPGTPTARTIAAIQGTGDTSPLVGQNVTTTGRVTGVHPGAEGLDGFFLQTGGTGGSTGPASHGIFVSSTGGFDEATLDLGDSVEVTGTVAESFGLTTLNASAVTDLATPVAAVTPLATAYPRTDAAREAMEGMLIAPTNAFTVTNTFSLSGGGNAFAEVGLASGTTPLRQPTDVVAPADAATITADNNARRLILDDGSNLNYNLAANRDRTLPWLARTNPIRVGARATLRQPVLLSFGFGNWRVQPQRPVTDAGTDVVAFENTRAADAAPRPVGGDLKLATFNVLNYFTTTGEEWAGSGNGRTCTYFTDRANNRIANNRCNPDGPRGAATDASLARQQSKIVAAINTMDADIVSLEELENSVKMPGTADRDDAIRTLVAALNAAAGGGTPRWAFVPSPAASELPAVSAQDVIRTGFIYDPSTVDLVGASKVLTGSAAFSNARQPLAQAFKAEGGADADAFAVVVNHFKSKSDSDTPATGDNANGVQGAFNGDRVRQANALVQFVDSFKTERSISKVFLTGDFNAYSQEDPVKVLERAGYTNVPSNQSNDHSYSFSGLSGSLDHVFANAAARPTVTGADLWDINASEPPALQYSRFNYHANDFFEPNSPFAASDHNPEVVGIDVPGGVVPGPNPGNPGVTQDVQILATNDYHGRLLRNGAEAGAAILAGAVKQLKGEVPNSIFASSGDLIGASTFESFIQDDEPTIDILNEAGLEVAAVGNHEFDKGYEDLVGRVQDRADWEYLGANVTEPAGRDDLAESWTKDFGQVQVGFVGTVTEDLPSLVAPSGIEGVTVTDIVEATNREAAALKAAGADVVVSLVHEGPPSTSLADATSSQNAFGQIVNGTSGDVDAIIGAHTHLVFNHSVPVPAWVTEGRAVTERPVVSAGQYGTNLNQLEFSVDVASGEVTAKEQAVLPLIGPDPDGSGPQVGTPNYPADQATAAIVAEAIRVADERGKVVLGQIDGPFSRAKLADGTTENRGGESTLGNLVAEIQKWATEPANTGGAQIAFMNPGGLRADLVGTVQGDARDVTFRQAASVQPFANTLVNMDLTGAQIRSVLEEQWQPAGASRPFLKLGISQGFTYTYEPPAPGAPAGTKGEVTGMFLDGEPLSDTATYSVTVNSFLASGGDDFATFRQGTNRQDTGQTDLQANVAYMEEFATDAPLEVDYSQRAVGAAFPGGAPASYAPGATVEMDLSSLSMTGPDDVRDSEVTVSLGDQVLGTAPVTTEVPESLPGFDEAGTASVSVRLPAGARAGATSLVVRGAETGTEVRIPIRVGGGGTPGAKAPSRVGLKTTPARVRAGLTRARVVVQVRTGGEAAAGFVRIRITGQGTTVRRLNDKGRIVLRADRFNQPGARKVVVRYNGTGRVQASSNREVIRVVR